MTKKKFTLKQSLIVTSLVLITLIVWSLFRGISDLTGSRTTLDKVFDGDYTIKEYVVDEVPHASQNFLTIQHSLNFIPAGNEHFYLVLSENYSKAVIVRANRSWGDQFDDDGDSDKSVIIRGKLKKISKEVREEFDTDPDLVKLRSSTDLTMYIDTKAHSLAWLNFAEAVLGIVLLTAGGVLFMRKKQNSDTAITKPLIITCLICLLTALVLWIYLSNMN